MIRTIYKVEGDSNEYDSEQEALLAEAIDSFDTIYIRDHEKYKIVKAITQRFILTPIVSGVTMQKPIGGQEDPIAEVDSWGPSA